MLEPVMAFLAAAAARLKGPGVDSDQFAGHFTKPSHEPEVRQAKPPVFKKQWWHSRRRLDARPLAWSLLNRPHDWYISRSGSLLTHNPSSHSYWVAPGARCFQYDAAYCNCQHASRGRFQRGQQRMFRKALNTWRDKHNIVRY